MARRLTRERTGSSYAILLVIGMDSLYFDRGAAIEPSDS